MDINELVDFNPWWTLGRVPERLLKPIRRDLFSKMLAYIDTSQIISLVGLRRTGKTTLFYQLIDWFLAKGVPPKNIIHFSFDIKTSSVREIIDLYCEYILDGGNLEVNDRTYLFLDEIQKLDEWENHIKVLYDRNFPLKIFISGSSGTTLQKKTKESLAGRLFTLVLSPLSFREYLRFRGIDLPEFKTTIARESRSIEIASTSKSDDVRGANKVIERNERIEFEMLKSFYRKLSLDKRTYLHELQRHIRRGGFIEALEMDEMIFNEYVDSTIIDKIVFQDIPQHYAIEEPSILKELLRIFAERPGQLLNYNSLASDLGRTRQTLSNYIHYLESAFLTKLNYNHSGSFITSAKKAKKIYLAHPSIPASISGQEPNSAFDGLLIENLIICETEADFFYRTPSGDEIDIILRFQKTILPIEIKYQNEVTNKDCRILEKYMRKNNISFGIIITKDTFALNHGILHIPAYMFLLLPDNIIVLAALFNE